MQLIASPGCKCMLDLQRTIKNQLFQNRGGIQNQINQSLISVFLSQLTGIMVVQCKSLVQTFKLGTISSKSWFQTAFKTIKIYMLLSLKYSLYEICMCTVKIQNLPCTYLSSYIFKQKLQLQKHRT
ncbi:Hypothetical_protein [Hexamita inflata]|uniref:Hypothetical_protein n=1 Tax=Hexamita inflata TaxID=28002 RepID=A0AA86P8Z0_9EUKA|nr:Hypothetical protein HINF_LOCUS21921 [Hexamita inflata]